MKSEVPDSSLPIYCFWILIYSEQILIYSKQKLDLSLIWPDRKLLHFTDAPVPSVLTQHQGACRHRASLLFSLDQTGSGNSENSDFFFLIFFLFCAVG